MLRVLIAAAAVLAFCVCANAAKEGDFTVTPIRDVTPLTASMLDREPGDMCDVGVLEAYYWIDEWLLTPEEYAVFADPAMCDPCAGGWEPVAVNVYLYVEEDESPCTITLSVGIREADMDSPGCYVPGDVICWSSPYEVVFSSPGAFLVGLPLDAGCETVDGPFFACFRTEDDPGSQTLPDLVIDDVPLECISYNDYGFGWEDLVLDYGFPGNVSVYATLECQEGEGYALDFKPGSCPNPINVKSQGKLPAAILGAEDFDVYEIDPESIMLACAVEPIRWNYSDVGTPVGPDAEPCECNELGPDGYTDLTLKFETQDVVGVLGPYEDGDVISLLLTATLYDGTIISLEDCLWVLDKGKEELTTALGAPDGSSVLKQPEERSSWATIKALYK